MDNKKIYRSLTTWHLYIANIGTAKTNVSNRKGGVMPRTKTNNGGTKKRQLFNSGAKK